MVYVSGTECLIEKCLISKAVLFLVFGFCKFFLS